MEYNIGDEVMIIYDELEPEYIGAIGEIVEKHFDLDYQIVLYKIKVDDEILKGVATEDEIRPA